MVAVLNGMLERLQRSALEEIERLTTMSEDLLLITRGESHQLPLERVPTDPNAIVRAALEQVHRLIEEKGLAVRAALDPAVRLVPLDPVLVTRLRDGKGVRFEVDLPAPAFT